MPTEKLDQIARDEALANAMEAEEYEQDGRSAKRDPDKLMRVREQLNAEERVATQGNVFQRGGILVSRRG